MDSNQNTTSINFHMHNKCLNCQHTSIQISMFEVIILLWFIDWHRLYYFLSSHISYLFMFSIIYVSLPYVHAHLEWTIEIANFLFLILLFIFFCIFKHTQLLSDYLFCRVDVSRVGYNSSSSISIWIMTDTSRAKRAWESF